MASKLLPFCGEGLFQSLLNTVILPSPSQPTCVVSRQATFSAKLKDIRSFWGTLCPSASLPKLSGQCCLPLPWVHKYNLVLTKCWYYVSCNEKAWKETENLIVVHILESYLNCSEALGREKERGRKRQCQVVSGTRGPEDRNFHSIFWLHFFHCRSHISPRCGSSLPGLIGLMVFSLGLGSSPDPPHCLFLTPPGLSL